MKLVKIFSVKPLVGTSINTFEGRKTIKRVDGRSYIEGSENLAKQMIDDINYEFEDAIEELEEPEVEELEENDEEEDIKTDPDELDKEEGLMESEKGTVGDDENRELLKKVQKLKKRGDLEEIAEELGLDHTKSKNINALKASIVKVIMGK